SPPCRSRRACWSLAMAGKTRSSICATSSTEGRGHGTPAWWPRSFANSGHATVRRKPTHDKPPRDAPAIASAARRRRRASPFVNRQHLYGDAAGSTIFRKALGQAEQAIDTGLPCVLPGREVRVVTGAAAATGAASLLISSVKVRRGAACSSGSTA